MTCLDTQTQSIRNMSWYLEIFIANWKHFSLKAFPLEDVKCLEIRLIQFKERISITISNKCLSRLVFLCDDGVDRLVLSFSSKPCINEGRAWKTPVCDVVHTIIFRSTRFQVALNTIIPAEVYAIWLTSQLWNTNRHWRETSPRKIATSSVLSWFIHLP